MFELSPTNQAAASNRSRLVRRFPATAVEIALCDFDNIDFRTVLTKTLTKMSQQLVRETRQMVNRGRNEQEESIETADPMIVTELFASLLRGCGKEVATKGICKNTREEVIGKGSKPPWRRSSLWLLLRVALQLSMTRLSGENDNTYKEFMPFLLAQALQDANRQQKIVSDVLNIMSTKVSRRLCKLRDPSDGPWLLSIRRIVSMTSETLHERWKHIRERAEPSVNLEELSEFRMAEHTIFTLGNTDMFLDSISRRTAALPEPAVRLNSHLHVLSRKQLPAITDCPQAYLPFHLMEIESWVAENLEIWIDQHMEKTDKTVRELKQLVETYHQKAANYYSVRPEGASRMVLTIGELWYAADVASIHEVPLLADFDPEIPTTVWQALLLSSARDMRRLKRLEDYVLERKRIARKLDYPSIFHSFGQPGSFAVEFFRDSTRLQQFKYEIERAATSTRQEKREEFRETKSHYFKLMQRHAASECDVSSKRVDGAMVHAHPSSCRRCGLEAKAKALAVSIHEWPLPKSEGEAQATVFELAAPATYSEWRDLTVYLINDVLSSQLEDPSATKTSYPLKTYQPLKPWYTPKGHCRIQLRSAAKPNAVVQRRAIPVENANESDVCLDSGLRYRYFDEKLGTFLHKLTTTDGLSELCTFKLPERAQVLTRFLRRTWKNPDGMTPNEVIASVHECPDWMSLSEFVALAGLPYGHKIQWMNLLTHLAMPKMDFNRSETATFLLQISLQAGPRSSDATRSTHARLRDPEFAQKMHMSLRKGILRVRANWDSHIALWSFTFLAARVLSLAPEDLSEPFLSLLELSREISYNWLKTILKRVEHSTDDSQRKELSGAALEIALICADSFNVHDGFLSQILKISKQASILVECSIVINDSAALTSEHRDNLQEIMFDRWRHTVNRAQPIMADQIASGDSFLSDAIHQRWRYLSPDLSWKLCVATSSWYQTSKSDLTLHCNILTGELLVNGHAQSSVPLDYERHDDYQRLFKGFLLHVTPSSSPGMAFSTTQLFHGYTVHFGRQGQDLLIRLQNDNHCFDLIPPRVFKGLLPDFLVSEYVHWYDNNTGFVEFCPLSQCFAVGAGTWRLERHAKYWKLRRTDGVFLLAPSSGLAQHIAAILTHLETPLSLQMLYDEKKSSLDISIPALQLQFVLKDGESIIRSRQFRGMHVDRDQSIGTLVGFRGKLVLRDDQDPSIRTLIVPEGEVDFKNAGGDTVHDHAIVSLRHGTGRRVQAFRIDKLLGRLVATTRLESKLYLAYLHALTSFCLPDPFLGRRGTEEAIEILSSASSTAPTALSPTACGLLDLIAVLAPSRHYHPERLRVMHNVVWKSQLSQSTQDDRFFKVTHDIFQRSSEIEFLYPEHEARPAPKPHTTLELVQRAISRHISGCCSGFGAGGCQGTGSETYSPRDGTMSDRAIRATEMAVRAFHRYDGLVRPVSGGFALHLYKMMALGKVINHKGTPSKRHMEYDATWLQKPSAFISSFWCQLHHAFQANQQWLNKMELMVWISTMAYSANHDAQITQALLMMALSPALSAAPLPLSDSHDLTKGYGLQSEAIEAAAASNMVRARQGPEGKSRAQTDKRNRKVADQLRREYGKDKKQAINVFRDRLMRQWPCQNPKPPSDYHMESYIDVDRAMKSVLPVWRAWWANKNFKEYLEGINDALEKIPVKDVKIEGRLITPLIPTSHPSQPLVSGLDLFHRDAPNITTICTSSFEGLVQEATVEPRGIEELTKVIEFLDSKASLQYERRYLYELRQSLSSLKNCSENILIQDDTRSVLFQKHLAQIGRAHV